MKSCKSLKFSPLTSEFEDKFKLSEINAEKAEMSIITNLRVSFYIKDKPGKILMNIETSAIPRAIPKENDTMGDFIAKVLNSLCSYQGVISIKHDEYVSRSPAHFVEISMARGKILVMFQDIFMHFVNGTELVAFFLSNSIDKETLKGFMDADFSIEDDMDGGSNNGTVEDNESEDWQEPVQAYLESQKASTLSQEWEQKTLNFPVQDTQNCVISMEPLSLSLGVCKCNTCHIIFNYSALKQWVRNKGNCPHCRTTWTDMSYYKK